MGGHSKFSPSASDKWINCPGYISLLEKVTEAFGEEESSEAAAEGTAAHEVAAEILSARNPTRAIREYATDVDTKVALEYYIDMVEGELDELHDAGLNPELHTEIPMKLSEELGGTADCVITHDKGTVVVDYKHGRGVFVAPESTQLAIYGYLASNMLGEAPGEGDTIKLCIVQPRYRDGEVERVRSIKRPLREFMIETKKLLDKALEGQTEGAYSAGKHCIFCAAKPFCPEKKEVILKTLEAGKDLNSSENLKFILDHAKELQMMIKQAQGYAIKGLEKGTVDPQVLGKGLKKRWSNRMWSHDKGEEGLAPLLRRHGVDKDAVWARRLISPAQAEKLVDDKKWLAKYIKKEERGLTLVDLDKADPDLIGALADEMAAFEPEEETEKTEEPKAKEEKKTINLEDEEF